MKLNSSFYKSVEENIIELDREFYEELIGYRGEIIHKSEHQAWLDWASDLVANRYEISYNEALKRVHLIENFYKVKGEI